MSKLVPTTDATFEADVLQSAKPVILDFTASWCGPCKMLKPVLEGLAKEYGDEIEVRTVDVDANPELSKQYDVRGVPTLLYFQGGQMRERMAPGTRSALARQIEKLLEGQA